MRNPALSFEEIIERGWHKEEPEPYAETDSVTEFELKQKIWESCKKMYIELDMTAREICHVYGVDFTPEWNRFFYRYVGKKGKGLGGSRKLTNQKNRFYENDSKKTA